MQGRLTNITLDLSEIELSVTHGFNHRSTGRPYNDGRLTNITLNLS
jgi:hypothetical protein